MIIVFGPTVCTLMTRSQSILYPVTGIGGPASALGNVNNAPTIASAKKPLRSCCLIFGLSMFFDFPFLVLAFFGFLSSRSPFWPSLMYCVRFLDRLRGKFGNFCRHHGLLGCHG